MAFASIPEIVSDIRAGRTKVKSRITINKPFDLGSVVADLTASGGNDNRILKYAVHPEAGPGSGQPGLTLVDSLLVMRCGEKVLRRQQSVWTDQSRGLRGE